MSDCNNLDALVKKEVSFAGVVSSVEHRERRQGKGWGLFTLEDFDDSFEFRIFGEEY